MAVCIILLANNEQSIIYMTTNLQCFMECIFKCISPDAGSPLSGSTGVSSLYHKVLDVPAQYGRVTINTLKCIIGKGEFYVPVKEAVIVVATSAESQKVLKEGSRE